MLAPEDLDTVKKRLTGELEIERNSTRRQAEIAFKRALYPIGHPNHLLSTDEELQQLKSVRGLRNFRENTGLVNFVCRNVLRVRYRFAHCCATDYSGGAGGIPREERRSLISHMRYRSRMFTQYASLFF